MASRVEKITVGQIVLTANPAVGNWLNVNQQDGLVTGLLARADCADKDGDRLTAAVIEKAAYAFAEAGGPSRPILAEHDGPRLPDVSIVQWGVAESAMSIFGSGGAVIPAGAWFAQIQCGPATMARIAKGEARGFSIEGHALVKRLDDEIEVNVNDLAVAIIGGIRQAMCARSSSSEHGRKPAGDGGRVGGGRMFSR